MRINEHMKCLLQVHETARHVASVTVSSASVSYDEMTSQCEALVSGKQQKMLVLQSFKNQNNSKAIVVSGAPTTNNTEPTFPNLVSICCAVFLCQLIYLMLQFLWNLCSFSEGGVFRRGSQVDQHRASARWGSESSS